MYLISLVWKRSKHCGDHVPLTLSSIIHAMQLYSHSIPSLLFTHAAFKVFKLKIELVFVFLL